MELKKMKIWINNMNLGKEEKEKIEIKKKKTMKQ